jgi:hypothetical protein
MADTKKDEEAEALKSRVDEFESFLSATAEARSLSERDRDYADHKQWTQAEIDTLKARGQAPVVINKVKTKVNLLTGIQRQRRTDPKALPRTPQHEKDADSVTDAIRYVADNTDFPLTSSECFADKITWGYEAAIIEVNPEDFDIKVEGVSADRFYFDPFSRRLDFKDARFMGIVLWMDEQDAKDTYGEKADEITTIISSGENDETFEDKPTWVDRSKRRIRVCQHFYRKGQEWWTCHFTEHLHLIDPKPSEYLDEDGTPDNPIEAQSAYIDRENNRYGEVRQYIWAQDEVNKRRSKFLYLLSVRQTMGDDGVVEDISQMKQELAKADGHVKLTGGPNKRFEILEHNPQIQGQVELYQDAKGDIDSIGANAALSGTAEQGMSGRAIQALQQGGIAELGALFDGHSYWERRIYRQVWNRIKQFWTEERWIRVTDNEDNLRWVHLNQQVTYGQKLQEAAKQGNQQAQQMLQEFINDPRLNEVVEVRNNTSELDVDIVLTQSVDYATLRQEQFDIMAKLAASYGPEAVPFEAMLRLSDMSNKDEVLELLKPKEEEQDVEQQKAQMELVAKMAEIQFRKAAAEANQAEIGVQEKAAKVKKDLADAAAQEIENDYVRKLGMNPPEKTSMSVGTGA